MRWLPYGLPVLLAGWFGVGYVESVTEARAAAPAAAVPVACPQYACKNVHASWSAVGDVRAEFLPNNGGNSVDYFYDIFATSSNVVQPSKPSGVRIDEVLYDSCIPTCGKDANGVWQAPQEVAIPVGALVLNTNRIKQNLCNPPANGAAVNPVVPSKNHNKHGLTPPMPTPTPSP
jgi:hypothetical protein